MKQKQIAPTLPQVKEIKGYKAFQSLQERVTNMDRVTPLILQLHSEFMQDRHWKKLMGICKKQVDHNSPTFCLNDIIKLELFKFADDVNELVEGAQKEAKIEKKLDGFIKTWDDYNIDFLDHGETKKLGPLDEIMEEVDLQSMQLMAWNSSKDSQEFKEVIVKWQGILKKVDSVLTNWVKVQNNWARLEPIFLQSEDIRAQLPEETKRFEQVDLDWKALMADASDDPGVVATTNTEGRGEALTEMQTSIDKCEKALHEYLEQKKKIFPRFYFVSNQALLEILSNGNNPEKVNEFLGDCFDGMKQMTFVESDTQRPWKRACKMISKDKEVVDFKEIFTCSGQVESYLCDLERMMQETLKEIIIRAS